MPTLCSGQGSGRIDAHRRWAFLRLLLPLLVGGTLVASANGAPLIKAKVEEPVLEELMGGCSLNCAFRWQVQEVPTSGGAPRPIPQITDESAQTAWNAAPAASGNGMRTVLLFTVPRDLPKEMDGEIPLYGLDFINGNWKTEALWRQHGRVKRALLRYNNKPFREILFADSRRWQRVVIPDIMLHSGDSITLEVLEIYPGEQPGAALSEVVFQGAH